MFSFFFGLLSCVWRGQVFDSPSLKGKSADKVFVELFYWAGARLIGVLVELLLGSLEKTLFKMASTE
jgi:hypothetical protein